MNPIPSESDWKDTAAGPLLPQEAPTTAETETPLSTGKTIAYSLANLGYGAFYSLNNALIPLYIGHFTSNAVWKFLMGSTHSFEGAVIQPIIGSASDRLHTPLGRRRPFILIFAPLTALLMLMTPAVRHVMPQMALPLIIGMIFLFTICFNIAEDPYKALMPDITPERQRGKASAVSQFVLLLGQAGLLLLPLRGGEITRIEWKFALTAVLILITSLLTVWLVKEPKHPVIKERTSRHLVELKQALRGLRILHQAKWTLIGLFFSGIGVGVILPSLTTVVKAITHCSDDEAAGTFLILMISTAITVLPFGWLIDRLGSKTVLVIGMVCILLASVNGLWVTTLPQIWIILCIAGVGNAAQTAAAYPLLTEVVPREEIGFYTGLQSTALSLVSPLLAIFTGVLVNRGGYRLIFVVCGVALLITLVFLAKVHMTAAVNEIAVRNREQGRTA